MRAALHPVGLRPVGTAESSAIADVLRRVRGEQFVMSGLPVLVAADLIDLQVRAQQAQYRATNPHARDHLIEVDGRAAGRCYIDRSGADLRVLDLAVVPELRRQGVGSAVLSELLDEASMNATCVHLAVWSDNDPARRLYTRLGFRIREQRADGCLELCRPPGAHGPLERHPAVSQRKVGTP